MRVGEAAAALGYEPEKRLDLVEGKPVGRHAEVWLCRRVRDVTGTPEYVALKFPNYVGRTEIRSIICHAAAAHALGPNQNSVEVFGVWNANDGAQFDLSAEANPPAEIDANVFPVLIMEPLAGKPLNLLGELDLSLSMYVGSKVAALLTDLHMKDWYFRDSINFNTMITPKGQPLVFDFGSAFHTADPLPKQELCVEDFGHLRKAIFDSTIPAQWYADDDAAIFDQIGEQFDSGGMAHLSDWLLEQAAERGPSPRLGGDSQYRMQLAAGHDLSGGIKTHGRNLGTPPSL